MPNTIPALCTVFAPTTPLHHMTHASRWPGVLRHGLQPAGGADDVRRFVTANPECVYFSRGHWAYSYVLRDEDSLIVRVELGALEESRRAPDEDLFREARRGEARQGCLVHLLGREEGACVERDEPANVGADGCTPPRVAAKPGGARHAGVLRLRLACPVRRRRRGAPAWTPRAVRHRRSRWPDKWLATANRH